MDDLEAAFSRAKAAYDSQASHDADLICKLGGTTIKLQKSSWTNDSMLVLPNKSGVFFSVWMGSRSSEQGRVLYNIHALKMRHLNGYSITSWDFATEFRGEFAKVSSDWPNVSVDFGPLTLMQGWIDLDMNTVGDDILQLMDRFQEVSPIIDRLLAKRAVRPKLLAAV